MSSKRPKIVFVADPIESFDPVAETTFHLMHEICQRSWECYFCELKGLFLQNSTPFGIVDQIKVGHDTKRFHHKMIRSSKLDLTQADAIFLRKDPPVDLNFIDHLSILELLLGKTLFVNNPASVKLAAEKIYPLHFKSLTPESLVSFNKKIIQEFARQHKTIILKPLNLSGGRGIVKMDAKHPSLSSVIDILTAYQTRYVMAQRFIPEAIQGDKRIMLLDGNILGAFLRVPPQTDFRGNLHSGAKLIKCPITKNDYRIIDRLKPELKKLELFFVGLDIIGNYLTEVNVTSPMGIREINKLYKTKIEKNMIDWLEKKLRLKHDSKSL